MCQQITYAYADYLKLFNNGRKKVEKCSSLWPSPLPLKNTTRNSGVWGLLPTSGGGALANKCKMILELIFFSPQAPHLPSGVVFYSPLADFSLLACEVS